jgi:hypothetical protein
MVSDPFDVGSDHPLFVMSQADLAGFLASNEDPALAACIERLEASLDDPDGIISAFQSFAST